MVFSELKSDWKSLIAAAADICLKPWKHAVVYENTNSNDPYAFEQELELSMRIECRNDEGERFPENDLELEIYRSGNDFNLMC